jgi:hypothetical protein
MRCATSLFGSLGITAVLTAFGCSSADDQGPGDTPAETTAAGAGGQIPFGSGGSSSEGTSTGGTSATGGGQSSGGAGKGGSSGGSAGRGGSAGTNAPSPEGGAMGNPEAGPVKPLPCASVAAPGVWENVTPPQVPLGANGSGVPNVVANPLSPGELFICTYKKGIYKSSDCGASWTKVDTGRNAAALDSGTAWLFVIDAVTPNVIYADSFQGSDNNLFKTTNGGVDWDPLWKPGEAAMKAAGYPELLGIDPTNHLHLVANFHQNCNAPYSPVCFGETTDGGATWRIVNGPPQLTGWAEDASPIVVNATTFLLGAIFTPLYLTTDDGATWKQVAASGGLRMLHENGWYYDGAGFSIQRSKDLMTWTSLDKTPGLVGFGFTTDGQTLFASSRYHVNYVRSPVADGATWTAFAGPPNLVNPDDGSYSLAVDTSHHILYSANQSSGIYRMSTASP